MAGDGTGLVVLGVGAVYDVHRPWGILPNDWSFGLISHVAVDSRDRVYFYQRKDPPILVFDSGGSFVTGWGDGRLRDAHGIYIGPDDHIYVCNRDEHEVLKLTPEGKIVLTLGQRGRPSLQAPFNHPADVAVDSRDRVYFYQRKDPPILVFDSAGSFVTGWGDGRLRDAHGIYIGPDDHIYACNRDEHEVLKLTPEGKIVLTLGHRGRPSLQAPFNHPADVAVAPNGDIYVADGYGNSAIHRFSGDGRHLGSWGAAGAGRGQFTTPHGIWVDARERVLVADRENNRVQLFSPEGDFFGEWADLYHPMDIYVDRAGTVYVTDQIPRITMYSPEGHVLARGRPVTQGAHGVWGDSRGNLYLAEVGVNQVTKLARRPLG